jgi:hypothetical protein
VALREAARGAWGDIRACWTVVEEIGFWRLSDLRWQLWFLIFFGELIEVVRPGYAPGGAPAFFCFAKRK